MALFGQISALVAGLATIAGLLVWAFRKTSAKKDQKIDSTVQSEEDSVNQGGRPKWD